MYYQSVSPKMRDKSCQTFRLLKNDVPVAVKPGALGCFAVRLQAPKSK